MSSMSSHFDGSTSSLESLRSPTPDKKISGARKSLLKWVKNVLPRYLLIEPLEWMRRIGEIKFQIFYRDCGFEVTDFGPSWRDGHLFLNIINTIQSNLVDITTMRTVTNRQRLETAFTVAEQDLGISRLLDPEVRC